MGMKRRVEPEAREVILQVRPVADAEHPWWPKLEGWYRWASIDPYDPPGWSMGLDEDYAIDSIELWKQTKTTLDQHIEHMKSEWLEECGPDEEGDGFLWEFRVVNR